ncbi:MAG TPA: c-type cytochrome [Polyangiaceae bacterium]|nr:c-type cytochrome [Polyangiaceae bacterium]
MSAALCGLLTLSAAVACGDDGENGVAPIPTPSEAGAAGQSQQSEGGTGGTSSESAGAGGVPSDEYNNVISDGVEITAEDFQKMCDERDGWAYVTAFCAGAGMCKGLSLLGTTLTDHSCKGLNSCGGAGCVDLPKDSGLTGKEIYADGPCGGCHGDWSDADHPKFDVYNVVYGPDMTADAALKRFKESSMQRLMSIVVFGTQGLHPDGTPYSNMPAYYQKYSRAEIERAIKYVQSLPTQTEQYDIFGVTPGFGIPEATGGVPSETPQAGGAGGAAP